MTAAEFFEMMGVKLSFAVAGLGGGTLRALSRNRFTVREMVASPICGMLAASYLTSPVTAYLVKINWPLPSDLVATEHGAAFLIGASAMWISDAVLDRLSAWFKTRES